MMTERTKDAFLILLLIALPVGCASLMSLDPVQKPPARYMSGPVTITVEYVAPEMVAIRCMQRGVPFLANECTGNGLKTLPDPCAFENQSYAVIDCHANAHARGWPSDHSNPPPIPPASQSPQAIALANANN